MTAKKLILELPIIAAIFDDEERVINYSPAFCAWVGHPTPKDLLLIELFKDTATNVYLQTREYIKKAKDGDHAECDISCIDDQNNINIFRVAIAPYDSGNDNKTYLLTALPLNESSKQYNKQSQSNHYLRVTMDTIDQGITIYNSDLELVVWNKVYENMQIFPAPLTRYGFPLREAYAIIAKMGVFGPGDPEEIAEHHINVIRTNDMVAEEVLYPPSGRSIKIRRYYLPDGGICATFTDITEQEQYEKKLIEQATLDQLTQTANRFHILNHLDSLMAQSTDEANRALIAVLFIDLDLFKLVNDTYGHSVGDEVLVETTKRLRSLIDEDAGDMIGRLGGDEFVIILTSKTTKKAVNSLCLQITEQINTPYDFKTQRIFISSTIGISYFPEHGKSGELLISSADTAMYHAKLNGRNQVTEYTQSIGDKMITSTKVIDELKQQIMCASDELYLMFQPIVALDDQRIIAAEALLRWHSQFKFNVTIQELIAILEDRGMIIDVGQFIFKSALDQASDFLQHFHDPFYLAMNVSPLQVAQANFSENLIALVKDRAIPAESISIEITESALSNNRHSVKKNLFKLRDAGINLAIDDFGTGFSSLSNLKEFPFTQLKIDRSFMEEVPSNTRYEYLVHAIMDISRAFEIEVVAEGIEKMEQVAFLREIGCQYGQGYLFSKPTELGTLVN